MVIKYGNKKKEWEVGDSERNDVAPRGKPRFKVVWREIPKSLIKSNNHNVSSLKQSGKLAWSTIDMEDIVCLYSFSFHVK